MYSSPTWTLSQGLVLHLFFYPSQNQILTLQLGIRIAIGNRDKVLTHTLRPTKTFHLRTFGKRILLALAACAEVYGSCGCVIWLPMVTFEVLWFVDVVPHENMTNLNWP